MTSASDLAIFGGPKAKIQPFGAGKRFGEEELAELQSALEQNTLFYWSGKKSEATMLGFCRNV